jgi:hypothetical protein
MESNLKSVPVSKRTQETVCRILKERGFLEYRNWQPEGSDQEWTIVKSVGWGPWRKVWFSVCSAHREPLMRCECCRRGGYLNAWRYRMSRIIYRVVPRVWLWWVNR